VCGFFPHHLLNCVPDRGSDSHTPRCISPVQPSGTNSHHPRHRKLAPAVCVSGQKRQSCHFRCPSHLLWRRGEASNGHGNDCFGSHFIQKIIRQIASVCSGRPHMFEHSARHCCLARGQVPVPRIDSLGCERIAIVDFLMQTNAVQPLLHQCSLPQNVFIVPFILPLLGYIEMMHLSPFPLLGHRLCPPLCYSMLIHLHEVHAHGNSRDRRADRLTYTMPLQSSSLSPRAVEPQISTKHPSDASQRSTASGHRHAPPLIYRFKGLRF